MSKKIKNLCVATGKYTNREGVEKTNWLNVGCVIQTDTGGKFILLDRTFNPAGAPNPDNKSTLIISMFDVDKKDGSSPAPESSPDAQPQSHFDDSEIPF